MSDFINVIKHPFSLTNKTEKNKLMSRLKVCNQLFQLEAIYE